MEWLRVLEIVVELAKIVVAVAELIDAFRNLA